MTVRVEALGAGGAVLLVTLDRPSKRNAVDHATLLELLAVQARLAPHAPDPMATYEWW